MNTAKTWLKKAIVFLVVAAMAIALFPFTGLKTVTKAEEGPKSLFAETEKYQATVSFGDDAGIPAGAYLVLTEFEEDSAEYAEAKDTLIQEDNGLDEGNFGMAAFDLTIYDADGVPVEPTAPVQVNIQMKELPAGVDPEVLEDSLTVQHLDESSGEIAVETVAMTDEEEVGEIVIGEDTAEAGFTVDSFSTFTITWSNAANTTTQLRLYNTTSGDRGRVVFNYVNGDGLAITRPDDIDNNTAIYNVGSWPNNYEVVISSDNVARAIDGRTYDHAYIIEGGEQETITRILFTRTDNNSWRYDYYNGETLVVSASGNNTDGNWRYPVYLQYTGDPVTAEVTLHFVDRDGNALSGFTYNGQTLAEAVTFPIAEILPNNGATLDLTTVFSKEGYTFDNSYIDYHRGTDDSTKNGTVIGNMLRRNNDVLQYLTRPSGGDNYYQNLEDGKDIYLVYSPVPSSGSGGGGDDGETPDLGEIGNSKNVSSKEDGTYKVALSVSGSAQHKTEETDINVIFVVDTSSSMNGDRIKNTKADVKRVAAELLKNNTQANPDAIELALVWFNKTSGSVTFGEGESAGNWTTDNDAFANAVGTDQNNGIKTATGTNWEEGLQEALALNKDDGDATYVIFFTDGAPTEYAGHNSSTSSNVICYWPTRDEGRAIVNSGKILYGIFAYGSNSNYLSNLIKYAYNSDSASSTYFFNASDADGVSAALEEILDTINMNFAYADVEINDGVTGLSTMTFESMDPESFEYKITYKDYTSATASETKTVNITVSGSTNNQTISIPAVTYHVLDKDSNGNTIVKEKTTSAVTIKGATYSTTGGKSVTWDMEKTTGTGSAAYYMLEDGWTYELAFTVWPSQASYDLVAALNNHMIAWGDPFTYIDEDGTEVTIPFDTYKSQVNNATPYSLKTNTNAGVKYRQVKVTTDSEGHTTTEYGDEKTVSIDTDYKMDLESVLMPVVKEFADDINTHNPYTKVRFYLMMDGKYYMNDGTLSDTLVPHTDPEQKEYTVYMDLDENNHWSDEIYIAPGVMTVHDGTQKILERGHTYSLVEKNITGDEYEYAFTPQTVRPMEINGILKYLVKEDQYNPATGTTYTIDGTTYFEALPGKQALIGTNRKTAELDITKMIVDNTGNFTAAQLDAETFTYRVTLKVPKDSDISGITAYEYVPRYNDPPAQNRYTIFGYQEGEDENIRGFSDDVERFTGKIYGGFTVVPTEKSGAERPKLSECFVESGDFKTVTLDITLKRNEIIRFTNLPADTQYTITEMYNNYRKADPSSDMDALGSTMDANIAEQGYTTSIGTRSRNPVTDTVRTGSVTGTTVTGTIDYLDVRYYNQFTNTLNDAIDIELKGTKHLDGYEWSGEQYFFNLTAIDKNAPLPVIGASGRVRFYLSAESGTDDKTYSFGRIRFTEPGTYTYKIVEDNPGTRQTIDGKSILFDVAKTVTIVIKENDGKLYVESVTGDDTTWNATTLTANTTITNTYETTTVTATKDWDDADNQDGKRDNVTFLLQRNGTTVDGSGKTIAATATDDDLTVRWTDLPAYDVQGKKITYTVIEEGVVNGKITMNGAEYTVTITSAAENSFTIKNSYTPETTTVKAKKVWDHAKDIDKTPPVSVNVQLMADETASGDPVALNEGNEWTYTWEDLPKYANGAEIQYSVDEPTVPAGYDKQIVSGTETGEDGSVIYTFTVTNTYNPTPVKAEPSVQKIIENYQELYNKGDFTFTIAATDPTDAPMPDEDHRSITNSADYELEGNPGVYGFGEIEFTKPGTYKYKVTEDGDVDGVKNDEAAETGKVITFVVEDDGTGKLVVSPQDSTTQVSFTNTYNASGEATITVTKAITGADWPKVDGEPKVLTFTLAGTGNAPMPEKTTATLDHAGGVSFSSIAYSLSDAGKTYTYTITEDGFGGAWTGSPETIKATVKVTDNGDGTLATEVTYDPKDATITNTYTAEGKTTIEAKKAVSGAPWPKDATITFTLAGTGDAPMPAKGGETRSLTEAGTATFGEIKYTEEHAGKTYTYTITEDGFGGAWTGSPETITATVKVTDNGDGTLATEVTYDPADKTITNTYEAEGKAELQVIKTLEGAGWPAGKTLTFTLAGQGGTLPATKTVTLSAEGTATFGAITYDESDIGKEYTYTITEDGFGKGWTGSPETITATVKVTDNGDGTLATDVTYDPADKTITNTYEAEGKAELQVIKALEGAGWPAGKTLTFTLAGQGGTLPATKTVTLSAEGTATFGAITYDESDIGKEYTYTITEDGFGKGWTGSPETITATVKVTDNGDGTLATEVTYDPTDKTIINTYKAKGEATIEATKAVSGAAWPKDGTITFTLAGTGNAPMPAEEGGETRILTKAGKATFGKIAYNEGDIGKTYTYTITEDGFGKGWTGSKEITATVKVTDNGDGTLKTEVTYDPADATITNTYEAKGEAELQVVKTLEGAGWPAGKTLTFTLEGEGGTLPATKTATLTAPGTATFGAIKYTEADAGKTYTYTITEDGFGKGWTGSPAKITAKVKVTDNGDGTLATEVTYDPADKTIKNTYKAEGEATIEVVKKLLGAEWPTGKKLTFTLAGQGGTLPATKTATLTAPGTATFGAIKYTEADAGKTYTYTITEDGFEGWRGTPKKITAKVKVTDNGDGTLATEVTYDPADKTFTNIVLIDIPVEKEWVDFNNKYNLRPENISLTLYSDQSQDPVATANVSPDAAGNWNYTFTQLPSYTDDGTKITYRVEEEPVEHYDRLVSGSMDDGFQIKNTLKTGNLLITKDLTRYNDFINGNGDATADKVTFIFEVTATFGESAREIYHDYVALTFDGTATTKTVELNNKLPVGAKVTVKEVDSGPSYKVEGNDEVTDLTITEGTTDVATANFRNAYDDRIPGGYGIVNQYTKDNEGNWSGKDIGDNAPAPTVN